jgi:thioredoxin-related protein
MKMTRNWFFPFISVLLLSCFSIAATTAAPSSFTGTELESGKPITVQPNAKGTVLIFLSAKCPCSNSHIDLLKNMHKKFKDFNFYAVHSNADETVDLAKQYFKNAQLPFPIIQDENTKLADHYKANRTPHVFVLDPENKVLYQGGITNSSEAPKADKNYLQDALLDIMAKRPVKTPEGRTLGCGIQRGKKT